MSDELHHPVPANAEQARQWIAALAAQISLKALSFRAPPEEPTSCCGRGCNGCVWEAYLHAVGYWCGQVREVLKG